MRIQKSPVVLGVGADDPGDADPIRILARQERRPSGGANGAIRVKVAEAEARSDQTVDIGGLKIRGTIGRKITIAEVIDQNNQEVWRCGRGFGGVHGWNVGQCDAESEVSEVKRYSVESFHQAIGLVDGGWEMLLGSVVCSESDGHSIFAACGHAARTGLVLRSVEGT